MVTTVPLSDFRGRMNFPIPEIRTPLSPISLIVAEVILRSVIRLESLRTIRFALRSKAYFALSVLATKQIVSCRKEGVPVVSVI